jgi:hypothetical protein
MGPLIILVMAAILRRLQGPLERWLLASRHQLEQVKLRQPPVQPLFKMTAALHYQFKIFLASALWT